MSTRLYFATDRDVAIPPIEELSRVMLLRDAESDDGRRLPRGSSGTVVSVYEAGMAYYVEFAEPFHALVTIEGAGIAAVEGETRGDLIAAARKPHDRNR